MEESFRFPFDSATEARLREKIAASEKAYAQIHLPALGGGLRFRLLDRQFRGIWTPLPWMMTLLRSTIVPLRNQVRRWSA